MSHCPDYLISKKDVNLRMFKENKIALIIPITSNNKEFNNIEEIDFIKIFLASFLKTYDTSNKYEYTFYLGYDHDDKYYLKNLEKLKIYFKNLKKQNFKFKFISIYNKKGHLSQIWNILCKKAIDDNNDYIYQLGDDIEFYTSGWENLFISHLLNNDNIGVIGPLDRNNPYLLTQSFVHKTHYKIFNYYFPKEIKNISVDNWIENIYKKNIFSKNKNRCFKIEEIEISNKLQQRRYKEEKIYIVITYYLYNLLKGKKILNTYLKNNNLQ